MFRKTRPPDLQAAMMHTIACFLSATQSVSSNACEGAAPAPTPKPQRDRALENLPRVVLWKTKTKLPIECRRTRCLGATRIGAALYLPRSDGHIPNAVHIDQRPGNKARMDENMQSVHATTLDKNPSSSISSEENSGKYLIFQLADEEFGIKVLKVREIMGVQEITAVPQTPAFVKGVINLRGKVIPVVDLRLKFSLPEIEYTQRTCIIVVQAERENGAVLMGIVVDGVAEVLNLAASDIEDTPDFGNGADASYLLGMAKVKGRVKILLDIDQVLAGHELLGLSAVIQ